MFRQSAIMPLSRDAASRFLPWLIAFMVWLATLALALVLALSTMSEDWKRGMSGTLTVQIVPGPNSTPVAEKERLDAALRLLRQTPAVLSAEPLPGDRIQKLLEPWLGENAVSGALNLPVPVLIDVRLKPGTSIDAKALGATLAAAVPGAMLDDHGVWLERLIELARAVEFVALAILAFIAVAATATVVFATRTGLAIHHEVIELLHVMGARDGYIASQFQRQTFWLSLKGGLVGFLLAAGTLAALGYLLSRIEAGLLPPVGLTPWQWGSLVSVAVCATVISVLTARYTVIRAVGRLP